VDAIGRLPLWVRGAGKPYVFHGIHVCPALICNADGRAPQLRDHESIGGPSSLRRHAGMPGLARTSRTKPLSIRLVASFSCHSLDAVPWGEASHQPNPVPTLRRRVLAKRATAMVRGLKILLTFGYAENAFNHNGRFFPGSSCWV
jgi:hypothetical protein